MPLKLLERPQKKDDKVMIAIDVGDVTELESLPEFVAFSLAAWKRHSLDGNVAYYEHAGLATTNSPYTRLDADD